MSAVLPSPDFRWDPSANPPRAGLRPKRDDTFTTVASSFTITGMPAPESP
jgi:hypothetical protein